MTQAESAVDVLVVGAGPVGLTVAHELARRGVNCRVVDRRRAPRAGTRGCTVWQRTLELFDLTGLPVTEYLRETVRFDRRVYHVGGRQVAEVDTREHGTPYGLPALVGQDATERMLATAAGARGARLCRGVAAVAAGQDDDAVRVELRRADGTGERTWCRWLVIAQGSHSALRDQLGAGWQVRPFPGTQLMQTDALVEGPLPGGPTESHLFLDAGGTAGSLPLPSGRRRVFLTVPAPDGVPADPPSVPVELEPLLAMLTRTAGVRLREPRFTWRVGLHNSIAGGFRFGRCLLAGDSAHTVLPVTAQGMNTGIHDAVNLGWKLAAVVRGEAGSHLLDSYEAERRPVAEGLLRRTARSHWAGVGTPPSVDEVLDGIQFQRRVRSQLRLSYPGSPLSVGTDGERAPALPTGSGRLRLLPGDGWTLLVPARDADDAVAAAGVLDRFDGAAAAVAVRPVAAAVGSVEGGIADPDGAVRRSFGLDGDHVCLVRPDGHLGYRGPRADPSGLDSYLRRVWR